jgi:putative ABC transport system permease protein
MIALLLSMLRRRRGQALAVVLAAAFLVAAAVAVPAYLAAADDRMVSDEWSAAPVSERLLTARSAIAMDQPRDRTFESSGATTAGPGFTPIFAAETDLSIVIGGEIYVQPRLVFRDGACAHVRLVAGRCPTATDEVMVSGALAARLHVAAGQLLPARPAITDPQEGLVPDRRYPLTTLAIAGVYRVVDTTDPYWADQAYFGPDVTRARGTTEPVFGSRGTLEALPHEKNRETYDYLLDRAAVRAGRLDELRGQVRDASRRLSAGGAQQTSRIMELLDRIDQDRTTLRVVLPLAAVPLWVLGWLLLYFAVGYAAQARRGEVGLVRMRGTPLLRRWWVTGGEAIAAVLIGVPVGFLLGLFGARAAAEMLVPDDRPLPTPLLSTVDWKYAGVGLAAGLLAALLATRSGVAGSVVNLLRRVPPRSARWRGMALEAVVVILGVAAAVQLRQSSAGSAAAPAGGGAPAEPTGVLAAAPALVVLAVAVLAARLVVPVAAASGGRAVRRGRLGRGLGALALARRPGVAALLVLLILAVGDLVLAAGTAQVASAARSERVRVTVGAPHVLAIAPTTRGQVINAVRAADPQGRYAMAVTRFAGTDGAPDVLAVDTTRLARVATWDGRGVPPAARVAALLHPPAPPPVLITGQQLALDLTAGAVDPTNKLQVAVRLAVTATGQPTTVQFGPLRPGRHQYLAEASACLTGCRLAQLAVGSVPGEEFTVSLVLHQLSVLPPGVPGAGRGGRLVPVDAGLDRADRWHVTPEAGGGAETTLAPQPDGLRVTVAGTTPGVDGKLVPADTPYPLPVISTGKLSSLFLEQVGQEAPPVARVGSAMVLPGLGKNGVLADLTYLDRLDSVTPDTQTPEIWLTADAPRQVTDRLAAAGLLITSSRTRDHELRYLGRQGPAAGVGFHLVAGSLGVLLALAGLALAAAVDLRHGRDLWVLRVQGVPARVLARSQLWRYAGLTGTAVLLGPVAAAVAWLATGATVPVFADSSTLVSPPDWPDGTRLLPVLAGIAVLLLGAAVVTAYRLYRSAGLGPSRRAHPKSGMEGGPGTAADRARGAVSR